MLTMVQTTERLRKATEWLPSNGAGLGEAEYRRAIRRCVFDLRVTRGLRPSVLADRSVVFVDRRRKVRFAMPAPYMVDARRRRSGAVRVGLVNVSGRWRLTLAPSARWLAKPRRAWPVRLDPSIDPTYAAAGCSLEGPPQPDSSVCAENSLKVGPLYGHNHATVLRFALPAALSDANAAVLARYAYMLDPVGNVIQADVSGTMVTPSTTDYAYNIADELCRSQPGTAGTAPTFGCPASAPPYTYDRNGNQTATPSRTATCNSLDQTTAISATPLSYLGAGQDRWVTDGTGTLQHNILGLGSRTVGFSASYFTRDDQGTLVSRRVGSTRHYYLFDALGSVVALTNSSGAVSARYDYEPYGTRPPAATGQWGEQLDDVPQGQFGFAGGYRTTAGLYHYAQRYYDPADMRWTQPDPIDQTGDPREGNRYLYAGANPTSSADPSGLYTKVGGGGASVCEFPLVISAERAKQICRQVPGSDPLTPLLVVTCGFRAGKGTVSAVRRIVGRAALATNPYADAVCAGYGVVKAAQYVFD